MLDQLGQVLASEREPLSLWPADPSCTLELLASEFTHSFFPLPGISLGHDFRSNITDQWCNHFIDLISFILISQEKKSHFYANSNV